METSSKQLNENRPRGHMSVDLDCDPGEVRKVLTGTVDSGRFLPLKME